MQLHNSGRCRPCVYWKSRAGCISGEQCKFCHMEDHPRKTNRPRPSKSKRLQCKQMVALVQTVFESNPTALAVATEKLGSKSDYMRSILGQNHNYKSSSDSSSSVTSSSIRDADSGVSAQLTDQFLVNLRPMV
jgi:hypothetical protein